MSIEVYALIGASGTGKSHNADKVMKEYKIDMIIDDGLLIQNGKKIAGSSAKAEDTTVGAVKRAIFHDPLHAAAVRSRIQQIQPKKILILGTSEKMIDKITMALDLPPVKNKIFITEISTPEQIELAQQMRKEGKHVIPLPSIEVKKELPKYYWVTSLWKKAKRGEEKDNSESDDKTIVRPKFSQMGNLTISENVIEQIVRYNMNRQPELDHSAKIKVEMTDFGVSVYSELKIKFGVPIQAAIEQFQNRTIQEIENMTNLTVMRIDVRITGITA